MKTAVRVALSWLAFLCSPPSARADTELPALHARFAMKHADGRVEHMELVRSRDRIEHRFIERGYSELWLRDARGELEHVRAFPQDGKSVHYTAGDLRTIHLTADWRALNSLLSERELSALRQAGKPRSFAAHTVRQLRGTLRGQPAQLGWIDAVALPAQLTLGTGQDKVVVSLLALSDCTATLCGDDTASLRSLEFADLGDMEYDPFVRRYLAHQDHGHAHNPH